jgi:negative regulator of replication initiation
MSKTIRIDQEVYEALAKQAQAFESPNKTLRRLLKVDANPKEKK